MRKVRCPAERRVCLLRPAFARGGQDIVFRAVAEDGGPVAGTIEERRRGLLGDKSVFHPLKPENRFRTGMMGGRIVLFAIAERDTQVMFLTGHTDQRDVMRWLAIGFAALFGAPMLIGLALSLIGAE